MCMGHGGGMARYVQLGSAADAVNIVLTITCWNKSHTAGLMLLQSIVHLI